MYLEDHYKKPETCWYAAVQGRQYLKRIWSLESHVLEYTSTILQHTQDDTESDPFKKIWKNRPNSLFLWISLSDLYHDIKSRLLPNPARRIHHRYESFMKYAQQMELAALPAQGA